jgi:UDP-N-acetylglucosamine 2-epimerase
MFREKEHPENFHLFRNMFPEDFLRLLCSASAIVGNSSVAIRECSYLGVPAINIGTRQLGRERGRNVIDVGHDRHEIAGAIAAHVRRGRVSRDLLYGDGRAGERIADCLSQAELTIEKRLTY